MCITYVFVICILQLPSTAIMAIKPTKRNTLAAIELMTQPRPALIRLMCLIQILYLIRLMHLIQILYALDTDAVLDTANVLDTDIVHT